MVTNRARRVPTSHPSTHRRSVLTRSFLVLAALTAACALFAVPAASAAMGPIQTQQKHFFWAPGQGLDVQSTGDSTANDLVWHGGNAGAGAIGVEQKPAVYLVWWGPQWAAGFQAADTDGKP